MLDGTVREFHDKVAIIVDAESLAGYGLISDHCGYIVARQELAAAVAFKKAAFAQAVCLELKAVENSGAQSIPVYNETCLVLN